MNERYTGQTMFAPDGWVYRARIGLLVPDGDVGPESEFSAMVPAGIACNASRFHFPSTNHAKVEGQIGIPPVEYVAAPGPLDDAVKLIARAPVNIIALAFSSTSYVGDDTQLIERLRPLVNGKPVVTTGQAICTALRQLGANRVMLVEPPWFPTDLTTRARSWLESAGFTIAKAEAAGLPTGQANIHPGHVYQWIRDNIPPDTEAIVMSGNGFRTSGVVRALERDLGIPAMSANSVLLWHALRTLELPTNEVTEYGQLFHLTDDG
ncbi:MAG: maleate cis-trans isomerase [Pseudomonadota bacterium]